MTSERINIVLVGGGGHCRSCIELIESTNMYNIIGILDLPSQKGNKVLGYEVIGDDNDYLKFKNKNYTFVVTTGQIKSSRIRKRIFQELEKINAKIATIISPKATISKHAILGKGTVVMHNCVVNASAKIGENCIINTASIIEHDVEVGSHTHISTNAVVNGESKIGNNSFIGSNSCISSGVNIGDKVIIGAGSTAINDILEEGVYIGSPAKKK